MTTQQLWMGVLTGSHRLFENDDHITLATKGVQPHSTSEELLTEFHELCSFNTPTSQHSRYPTTASSSTNAPAIRWPG